MFYLNTDGGARGNPGPAAIGAVVWDETHQELATVSEAIGEATNNVAEYKALIAGLELAAQHTSDELHIFMDSELIVKQINGEYRVKQAHLQELFAVVAQKRKAFAATTFTHVQREDQYQRRADQLVNQALDA